VEGGSLARRDADRAALEVALGHRFARPELLERALTHSSRSYEDGDDSRGNERLEFLGDAVLGLVISELLMEQQPSADEGALSRLRADLVNATALAERARALGLDAHLRLGRGEEQSGGRGKARLLSGVFEAVLGALYLDGGLAVVHALVVREFGASLRAAPSALGDPKTQLQELLQARGLGVPVYATTASRGPAHAREFEVEVHSGERVMGSGCGRTKRQAEQEAARAALALLASPAP
jgi:ribonuclease III